MQVNIKIAIVHNNYLLSEGLRKLLLENFDDLSIIIFNDYNDFFGKENYGSEFKLILLPLDLYFIHQRVLKNQEDKIITIGKDIGIYNLNQNSPYCIDQNLNKQDLLKAFKTIFCNQEKNLAENQEGLTPREVEVLKLVAIGMQNKQIAERLTLSSHTVVSHRKNITKKLGITTVSGLTVYALINGLINSSDLTHPQ